ncbi:MAG TPA: T9SS type A sorting domain-containing protein [Saprospiraceae bacterium]|nr:T9SS type A sorting domain-containing protein [Saprospiraceae bacterium]
MHCKLLPVLLLFIHSLTSFSQAVTCDQFCVRDIGFNLAFPEGWVVRIEFSGDSNEFINYPYVQAVLDEEGDTLATGDIFYFGQFSNTTTDYPVSLIDSIPEGFSGTVIFRFDTMTCELPFPCTTSFIGYTPKDVAGLIHFHPNPVISTGHLNTSFDLTGCRLEIIALTGQVVRSIAGLSGTTQDLTFENLPPGIYLLKVNWNGKVLASRKVVVE